MKKIYTVLLFISLSACSILNQEEFCTLLSEPLTDDNIISRDNQANVATFNNTFIFRARRAAEVFYQKGDCFIGDYSTEWTYSGQGQVANGSPDIATLEATTPGRLCVVVSASGNSSNQVCQDINLIKHNVWSAYADDFPSTSTFHRIILNINGRIFSGFGMNNDWFELDTATFSWTEKNHITNLADFNAFAGFAIGDKGYLVGNNSILYEYTPVTDTWIEKGSTPFNVSNILSLNAFGDRKDYRKTVLGLSIAGKGYFGLGDLPYLWEYDPIANTWEEKAQLPERPDFNNHAFSFQNEIYFGQYIYNPTSNIWREGNNNFNTSENLSPGFVEMDGEILGARNGRTVTFNGMSLERVEEDTDYLPYAIAPVNTVKNGVSIGNYAFFVGAVSAKTDNKWFYYVKD